MTDVLETGGPGIPGGPSGPEGPDWGPEPEGVAEQPDPEGGSRVAAVLRFIVGNPGRLTHSNEVPVPDTTTIDSEDWRNRRDHSWELPESPNWPGL